ncbi:MAG: c-type cytochrome [Bacteroidia bacterium]|nr:c-type cytochrome [Bacteroidia bacterium]
MKKIIFVVISALWMAACGGGDSASSETQKPDLLKKAETPVDDGKGIGEVKHVELNDPLDEAMVKRGNSIYDMKCAACHKLTNQRVVGPGWAGVTSRRKPEWIMNMTTNVEVMLEKDPAARAMLKECLVQMPNQNLSIGDARDVLEFMYANDAQPK